MPQSQPENTPFAAKAVHWQGVGHLGCLGGPGGQELLSQSSLAPPGELGGLQTALRDWEALKQRAGSPQ